MGKLYITGNIVDILRNTLHRLEETATFEQGDPAVIQLKRHIVQSIAELEVMKEAQPRSEPEKREPALRAR